ncbi:PucR-like helix-turn-helix protein [Planifilum fimeticola]|jgi:hypothetical protein|uniref:PucR-like helix-turn-helix protein n=1 Tax=Planifilum fimeticola TaxID=201975 RepID=A0A2T0LGN0_9BACL|nr:helix-turn-helix domain-containing protein [Planifilum fimeticola]PRX41444.1 PucR-like helix-turn-helix protein [Planifilum fimeticola]
MDPDLQHFIRKLSRALGLPVRLRKERNGQEGKGARFPLRRDNGEGETVWLEVEGNLSTREVSLVRLLLTEWERKEEEPAGDMTPLIRWLKGDRPSEPPPDVDGLPWDRRVPFYVVHRGAIRGQGSEEIRRILARYFEGKTWILPLYPGEMLLLVPWALVDTDGGEPWQEVLLGAAEGLADVVTSEAGERVRVMVHPPVESPRELPGALASLREAGRLGRTFYPEQAVHGTWQLRLERLLDQIGREEAEAFLSDLSPVPFWEEVEWRRMLEVFFRLDGNVSEAARRLHLHRNTLVYRLDRLKQETGLDARRFEDAVAMRLALLLSAKGSG